MDLFIKEWLGKPYQEGGKSEKGVDCVGLLLNYLKFRGINMERVDYIYIMMNLKKYVERVDIMKPGDIVLVEGDRDFINHVGIAVGREKMIHSIEPCGVIISHVDKGRIRGIYRIK